VDKKEVNRTKNSEAHNRPEQRFRTDLARAFAGAVFFSLPLLMTSEMWQLGFYIDRLRLLALLIALIPLLILLSRHAGFEQTNTFTEDVRDAFIGYAVGICTAGLILLLFSEVGPGMSADEITGKISLQAVPGSIGALLARSEFGTQKADQRERSEGKKYGAELFLMGVGSLFFSFHIAPMEEIVMISYMMTEWLTVILAAGSLLMIHAFVYVVEFKGHATVPAGTPAWNIFLRFSITGYGLALLISIFVLWVFGRTDGMQLIHVIKMVSVLGFPAALGAAAARLIL
jgi:putative integral membrane protein (TIGR02587 family)